MRTKTVFGLLLILSLLAIPAAAGEAKEITVEGKIACAKCTLKMEGATDCQNVLVVAGKKDAKPAHYYLVDNEVAEAYGHVCQGEKGARVTGTVAEKDGKMWLTPTKMEAPEA